MSPHTAVSFTVIYHAMVTAQVGNSLVYISYLSVLSSMLSVGNRKKEQETKTLCTLCVVIGREYTALRRHC